MGLLDFLGTNPQTQYQNTVQAPQIALDPNDLAAQQAYQAQIEAQANGTGPSLATQMLQNNADTTAGNAVGLAAAQRGVNPGAALTSALQAGGQAQQQSAQQAATARTQEQLGADQQLGAEANTMQSQAVGVQGANQNATTQANQTNAQLATGAASNNSSLVGGLLSGLGSIGAAAAYKGEIVPGHATVKGDSILNDKKLTYLSPDETVIPRSVSSHPGFHEKLEKIVREMPGKGPQGFAKVLAARKGA